MWKLYILYHTAHDSGVMKVKRLKTCVGCGRGHDVVTPSSASESMYHNGLYL